MKNNTRGQALNHQFSKCREVTTTRVPVDIFTVKLSANVSEEKEK